MMDGRTEKRVMGAVHISNLILKAAVGGTTGIPAGILGKVRWRGSHRREGESGVPRSHIIKEDW